MFELNTIKLSGELLIFIGSFIFLMMLYFSIQSFIEKEHRAGRRFVYLTLLAPVPYYLIALTSFKGSFIVGLVLISLTLLFILLIFLPLKRKNKSEPSVPKNKIDERDIMFSRRLLEKGSEKYNEYYQERPENLEPDEDFRRRPGLLSKGTVYYDPVMFASSEASFYAVEQFKNSVSGKPLGEALNLNREEITQYIKHWAKKFGAIDIGITGLKDYHIYSHTGRGPDYGKEINLSHKFAIAFTVEMNFDFTSSGPQAPIVMESGQQYLNAGAIAIQLASFIRNLGHEARAHIDANYQVICPLVAKDAGLGELGRMGLLMTPKQGPRVRIGVVTTDLPLITDGIYEDPSLIEFCKKCKKCADTCPSRAIPFDDQQMIEGVRRWQISQEKCFQFWCTAGTDCGRCMAVCPYSHPDNLMHRLIRFGIRNNFIFSRLALVLDDWFYGRKPAPKAFSAWMKVSNTNNKSQN